MARTTPQEVMFLQRPKRRGDPEPLFDVYVDNRIVQFEVPRDQFSRVLSRARLDPDRGQTFVMEHTNGLRETMRF